MHLASLGTFRSRNQDVKNAVTWALEQGIRHIDTASIYKNEQEIGEAIREAIQSGIISSRNDIFITTKISPYEQGTEKATAACTAILERLNLDYVDLVLIHWPGVSKLDAASDLNASLRKETWKVLETFYNQGFFKSLGVSNYELRHLEDLSTYNTAPITALQVECHPLWPQTELREFCSLHNIQFIAYSSLGGGELLTHPIVVKVAERIGKTAVQTLLCWGLQKGCCVIPKSVHKERIEEFAPHKLGLLGFGVVGGGGNNHHSHSNSKELIRYLDEKTESELDSMGSVLADRRKFCWDPSIVLQ